MPDITLSDALAALFADLRNSTSGDPADGVDVDLSLVAVPDEGGVRWRLAAADETGTHRVRLTVHPWQRRPSRVTPDARVLDEIPAGLTPPPGSLQLPPIVRPKPGIEKDRDGE